MLCTDTAVPTANSAITDHALSVGR